MPEMVETKIEEARMQLKRYAMAANIEPIPNLHLAAVVFAGTELKAMSLL